MKNIILLMLISVCTSVTAQSFGTAEIKVGGEYNQNQPVYGKWLLLSNKTDVVIKFQRTTDGLDSALDLADKLLVANNLDMDNPDIYKTMINDGKRDNTKLLYESIIKGTSKINEAWNLSEGSTLHLFLSKDSFEINIIKAYKQKH